MESPGLRHTCLKLHIDDGRGAAVIFVKGTWLPTRFELFITDGLDAWICSATETEVEQRAELWDQHVSEYIAMAERHLGFQQPGSIYRFEDAGVGEKRLSWTFEKQGTRLEWRWKCQSSANSKQVTANILDFLMDANTRLSEEVVSKRQSFERLKAEAEKCLAQSEKYCIEKKEFEDATYGKFVAVLNSKKAKLRQLRDRLSRYESTDRGPQCKDDSGDNVGAVDMSSEDEETKV
ncbi:unnamed protein product [Spirodela intermedia]|uniref:Uncharacterized protein n=1 Tax=Spirodela intermedia TaxID=51605 RepID=A0A7I8IXK1_SPIIN|nr:unnamed protein product [Spirodela intermedia]CAA6662735.1 unnamed protein product [Spirodela intermedia]